PQRGNIPSPSISPESVRFFAELLGTVRPYRHSSHWMSNYSRNSMLLHTRLVQSQNRLPEYVITNLADLFSLVLNIARDLHLESQHLAGSNHDFPLHSSQSNPMFLQWKRQQALFLLKSSQLDPILRFRHSPQNNRVPAIMS